MVFQILDEDLMLLLFFMDSGFKSPVLQSNSILNSSSLTVYDCVVPREENLIPDSVIH